MGYCRAVYATGCFLRVQSAGLAGTGFFATKSSCAVDRTCWLGGVHFLISTPAYLAAASVPFHARALARDLIVVLRTTALAERPRALAERPDVLTEPPRVRCEAPAKSGCREGIA